MSIDVAIYLPSLGGGGAERIAVTLANEMAERGMRVDLVLASAQGPHLANVSSNVRVVDLRARRVLFSLPGLVRYFRRERPVAMLSLLDYANVVAVVAKMISGVTTRVVISERSLVTRFKPDRWSATFTLLLLMMRWTYPRADGVIAISRGVAEHLSQAIQLPSDKITVVYNAVVTPELYAKAQEPLEHPWLGEGKPPVILGVGRLTPAKDFTSLIRAFGKVRAQCDCRLVILGEGELRPQLESLVVELGLQDSVQLPGFVENPFAWMSCADLFVSSSAWEGFGNVLVEAMACEIPVISTDCPGGPREILENGKWGVLVPVGNVDVMAQEMLEVLHAPAKTDATARVRDFGASLVVTQYLKTLFPDRAVP